MASTLLNIDPGSFVVDKDSAASNRGAIHKRFLTFHTNDIDPTAYSPPLYLPQELIIDAPTDKLVHDFQYILIDPLRKDDGEGVVDSAVKYKMGVSWAVRTSGFFAAPIFSTEQTFLINAVGPIHRGFHVTTSIEVQDLDNADTGDLVQIKIRRLTSDIEDTAEGFLAIFSLTIYKE